MSAQECMPQPMELSERIQILRRQLASSYDVRMYHQRREVYEHVWQDRPAEPATLRAAHALAQFLAVKGLKLTPDDLLAGGEQYYDFALPVEEGHVPDDPWRVDLLAAFRQGHRVGLFCGALGGHVIAGYHRVLEHGLGALVAFAARQMRSSAGPEHDFAKASLLVCTAASDYIRRYAARAGELACHAVTAESKGRLQRIAVACDWVATSPPRTFYEALQLLWLTHEVITCEQSSGSLSLGRLDQVLYPYYVRDLAVGLLTRVEAAELIEALWVKLAGLRRGFQHVTLGGSDAQGHDMANELSFMCLRATHKLRMDQPLLSVRWHPNLSQEFWHDIEALLGLGLGYPALFNEEVVIAAKTQVGISTDDARRFGIVGCVEPVVPGKELSHTEGLRVNWAKVLEAMLNDGRCTVTGEVVPLAERRDLETITSFDEFYRWYRRELAYVVDLGIHGMNILDETFSERTPYPFLSSTIEGCIERGRDVTAGSTVYNLSTVNGLAMANVADALVAIRQTVFEKHLVSLRGLAQALRDDWAGQEALRQAVLRCPKYGNDLEEPDHILRTLCDDFVRQVSSHRNGRGGRMQCGLYTVDSHGFMGKLTGALPDGRRRGVALANGLSPVQGTEVSGPTAVMRSCTKVDHRQLGNGMVLDIKFAPTFFHSLTHQGIFRALVEAYFHAGGMEVQFNVIDRATLLAAQRSPQDYRDLIVRVSGFSACFVDLDPVVQNEIIARTEHASLSQQAFA